MNETAHLYFNLCVHCFVVLHVYSSVFCWFSHMGVCTVNSLEPRIEFDI